MFEEWETARSEFNHGWLKNQFIAVLLKCRQVEQGRVLNDNALLDLKERLSQWDDARKVAEAVVAQVQDTLDRKFSDDHNAGTIDASIVRLANEVERQRWICTDDPRASASTASAAIARLDSEIGRAQRILDASPGANAIGIDGAALTQLIDAAQGLSAAFSHLTLCRSIPELA